MTLNSVKTEKITKVFKSIFNLLLSKNVSLSLIFTSFLTLQAKTGVGASGTPVPMGTRVPAGTHRNFVNLGTAGYRVPRKFEKFGTAGYRVPSKFWKLGTAGYRVPSKF